VDEARVGASFDLQEQRVIVGIDLGTTHSLIGLYGEGGPRLFPNALGSFLTPSVISLGDDDAILVGEPARDRLITHPDRTVASFKRLMGTSRETRLGAQNFRAEDLSAFILRALIADAEAALGVRPKEAVISVPAYFSDAQRKATRAAGELAGIHVRRLVNEPTAAALAYGLEGRKDGGRFMVFDLGGGTFDVSILEIFDGVVEVHATAGDNFLGGEDFLEMLVKEAARKLELDVKHLAPRELAMLRARCETLKRALTNEQTAEFSFPVKGVDKRFALSQTEFEMLVEPLIQRLRLPLERALRDSKLNPGDVDEIVLVGGASRMALAPRLVSRMFGRLPMRHIDPDRAIAMGAAIAAGLAARDARLEEVILTDVCPYTLGIEVALRDDKGAPHDGFFSPIIARNSVVPISREQDFYPLSDDQKALQINIFQGESPTVAANVKLGEISFPLRGATVADKKLVVRFTYDVNGLLQVEAHSPFSGERRELVIEQNPGVLTKEEIAARLAELSKLRIHPREQQENVSLLARAARLYEEHIDAREALQNIMMQFRSVVESQEQDAIRQARVKVSDILDEIERG
jgi:molecular chaperone HscC